MSTEQRLLALSRPVRGDALLGIALAAATLVAGIALIGTATYLISRAAQVTLFVEVAVLVVAVRGLAIGRAALRYAERYVTHRTTLRLLASLRSTTFRALEPRLPALAGSTTSGDLLARLGPDIDALDRTYLGVLVPACAAMIGTGVAVVALGLVSPDIAIVFAIGVLAGGMAVPALARSLTRPTAERSIAERARLQAATADDLAGTAELIAFGAPAGFEERTGRAATTLRGTETRLGWLRGFSEGAASSIGALTALVVLALAIPLVGAGVVEPTLLAVLPLVALAAFDGVQPLAASMEQRDTSRAAAARVFELIDAPLPVREPVAAAEPPEHGDLALEGVAFRYEPQSPWVVDDLDVVVPDGGRLAISGPSGSGKSTIVDLLVRFREPGRGRICLGGTDLATMDGDALRERIAVVPQRVYLFNGTLRDNLLVARGDADDDALLGALDFAALGEYVAGAPAGLDTPVGENGLRLSGGERQRVAIARMLLKDAPIVVLDEATSQLDLETEAQLVARLDAYLRGRTAVVLAHPSALLELGDRRLTLPGRELAV
jgi:ATP-binding cassette, subfamily C, bacterial CydC